MDNNGMYQDKRACLRRLAGRLWAADNQLTAAEK